MNCIQNIRELTSEQICEIDLSKTSRFYYPGIDENVSSLKNDGDEWKEAVYICRTGFATSFALVPPDVVPVDDRTKIITKEKLLSDDICGEEKFWNLSRAIMKDTINDIATFWLYSWVDYI